jgi:iron complex transport system ATP-binding protein
MLNIQKVFNVNSFVADDLLTGELELHGMDLMRPAQPIKRILRVHVVGGGGETNKIFYILKSAGFEVTAGILTDGTNDHWSACILGLDFVSVPDPTALDEKMLVKNKDLISSADYIVVCNGIFAEINLINLREIETCRNVLLVEESGVLPSDYTSGKAITIYQELRKVGRITSLQRLTSELQADRVEP